jgi:tripartite ATP-independent transporter DctP family solute receptor
LWGIGSGFENLAWPKARNLAGTKDLNTPKRSGEMQRSKFLIIPLIILLALALVACVQTQAPAPSSGAAEEEAAPVEAAEEEAAGEAPAEAEAATESEEPVTLQFASVSVPDDAHTKGMQVFADEVAKLSDGNITVEVFPGGQLFTQEGEQDAIRAGNLDIAYSGPNWLAQFVPYMSMFAAPYMFTSYDHMSDTFNGPIGQAIFDDVAAQTGVRPLGAFYLGTRQLNLRDIGREVTTPQDMEGVKLRMPNTATWLFMGEALGANPTPLAFTEVYLGLQTGTIDGQDNPLPTDKNAKFYEVTKYIILTDHFIHPQPARGCPASPGNGPPVRRSDQPRCRSRVD